jgi:hypothetical protein
VGKSRLRYVLCAAIIGLLLAPAVSRSETLQSLAVQGGWWNVEAEYRTPFGVFLNAGVPWFAILLDGGTGGTDWNFAVGGKLGYQIALSESFSLRFGIRDAQSIWRGCPCADSQPENYVKTFISFEAGVRFETSSGFLFGADLSAYAFLVGESGSVEHFWPGYSLLFSQAYVGYRWSI